MMGIDTKFLGSVKGFMPDHEALELYRTACEAAVYGPCLEIGSYCGKSACIIGAACREAGQILFSVDHHRGSEEQQPGQEYFDPDLFDPVRGMVDTLPVFRETLERAGLSDTVVPIVSSSLSAGKSWATPLSLLFIDGGHTIEAAFADYDIWSGHVMHGGFLVIHDIFMNPDEGGQAPRMIYETALESDGFEFCRKTDTLGVLRRI